MTKYRKKPVVVDAFRFGLEPMPDWFTQAVIQNIVSTFGTNHPLDREPNLDSYCVIKTLEGDHIGRFGEYIIQGVKGELYPCKPDIFNATYEMAECPKCGVLWERDSEAFGCWSCGFEKEVKE